MTWAGLGMPANGAVPTDEVPVMFVGLNSEEASVFAGKWLPAWTVPILDGFLNHWHATVPVGNQSVETVGVCTVQLRKGLIYSNQVFFDRSKLQEAIRIERCKM